MLSGVTTALSPDSETSIHPHNNQKPLSDKQTNKKSLCLVPLCCFDPRLAKRSLSKNSLVCLVSSIPINFIHIENCTWVTERLQSAWLEGWPRR